MTGRGLLVAVVTVAWVLSWTVGAGVVRWPVQAVADLLMVASFTLLPGALRD